MFILVNYNNKTFESIEKEAKKFEFTSVPLYKLILTKNKEENKSNLSKLKKLVNSNNLKYSALQITLLNIDNSTQSTINSLKQDFDLIIGLGGLNKVNRFFLEQTQIDFLQDPQNSLFKSKFDFIHHFNSGLNQVLCKFAKEKQIGLIHSLNFLNKNPILIIKEIGRITQNTKFARKYKIPIYSNFIIENKEQLKTLIQLESIQKQFNMDTQQIKESQNLLENKIKLNQKKKSKEYICEGIEKIN